jgi:cytochrome c553
VRQNEMMTIAAKELADAEIQNLAAYYAAIQIEVIPP